MYSLLLLVVLPTELIVLVLWNDSCFWCYIRVILQRERERSNNCCDALCCQEWSWVNCASLGAFSFTGEKVLLWGVQTQWVRELRVLQVCKILILLIASVLNVCNRELVLFRIWQYLLALRSKLSMCFFFWLKDLLIWFCQIGAAYLVWDVTIFRSGVEEKGIDRR